MNSELIKKLEIRVLLVFSLLSGFVFAQNLAPNPDFENFSNCPTGPWDLDPFCNDWYNPTTGSADYNHSCGTGSWNVPGAPGRGPQFAYSGDAYIGIFLRLNASNFREYVQARLITPLSAGLDYNVSFFFSVAEFNGSPNATDGLGALFTNVAVSLGTNGVLPFSPQVENALGNQLGTDATNWFLFSGSFTAAGGEEYITIGNFRNDANTNLWPVPVAVNPWSYYFIDLGTVAPTAPLDLECLAFEGKCIDQKICLKWEDPKNTPEITWRLERKDAQGIFREIYATNGRQKKFEFRDQSPLKVDNFYRLIRIDESGMTQNSKTLLVTGNQEKELHLFPNPVSRCLKMSIPYSSASTVIITLRNTSGKTVLATTSKSNSEIELDLAYLPSGNYFLTVQTGTKYFKEKVVVCH